MASSVEAWMIIETLPTPALVLDEEQVVLAANAKARALLLREKSAPVGKNFKDAVADRWREQLSHAVGDVLRNSGPEALSVDGVSVHRLRRRDGSVAGVVITGDAAAQSDKVLAAALQTSNADLQAANDELDARLEELRNAYRLDDERTRFLATLAHELRNPLAGITSALYLLRRRHVTGGDRLAEHALRVAERQSKNQGRLLEDLLDASRLVLGKITLRVEPTDFAAIVRHALDSADFAIRARAHTLRASVPDRAIVVRGDALRLEQIVANLLSNAVKYTPVGGEILVTLSPNADTAVLTIKDSGAGIEPELLERVFDLFTQGDATRGRMAGGLGIGLTVARQLVELHGGTIDARSAGRGQGSTFEVRLPRTDAAPIGEQAPVTMAKAPARRILVVDDNRDARDMLRTILELDGHHVQDAPDGNTAVRLAVESTPEVALIDIGLPEVDGYEVARRIRKRLGSAVRLIALTGYGDPEARRLAIDAGFDEHLVKPVDPELLADLLRSS